MDAKLTNFTLVTDAAVASMVDYAHRYEAWRERKPEDEQDRLRCPAPALLALTLSVVRRFTLMQDHTCHASVKTMGERTGLPKRTMLRCLSVLRRAGYLEVIAWSGQHVPTTYRLSESAMMLFDGQGSQVKNITG